MAEVPVAPAASFAKVEGPKPTNIVEKVKHYRSPEQKAKRNKDNRERQDRKQNERVSQRTWTRQEVADYAKSRKDAGSQLNMLAHPAFERKREELTLEALAEKKVQGEVLGNRGQGLTPTEQATVLAKTYNEFAQLYPDLAEICKGTDIYFTQPDNKGLSRISYSEDPFMRAVDANAQARVLGNQDAHAADQVYDEYYAKYKGKADIYANIGHPGLRQARERAEARGNVGVQTPDAARAVVGVTITPEAGKTRNLTEEAKAEIKKMGELSANRAGLSVKDKIALKDLEAKHTTDLAEAKILLAQLDNPQGAKLTPDEEAKLLLYEDALKASGADTTAGTQKAVATGTPTTPDAQTRADQAKLEQAIRTQGVQIIGDLKSRGVDISTMSEKVAIERLRDKKITNPDGSTWQDDPNTRAYIHEAFVEQQKQQAEVVMARLAPAEVDALKKKHQGDALGLALALLALAIGSFTPEMKATLH